MKLDLDHWAAFSEDCSGSVKRLTLMKVRLILITGQLSLKTALDQQRGCIDEGFRKYEYELHRKKAFFRFCDPD